jgi:hypothetical protein
MVGIQGVRAAGHKPEVPQQVVHAAGIEEHGERHLRIMNVHAVARTGRMRARVVCFILPKSASADTIMAT